MEPRPPKETELRWEKCWLSPRSDSAASWHAIHSPSPPRWKKPLRYVQAPRNLETRVSADSNINHTGETSALAHCAHLHVIKDTIQMLTRAMIP